eukprot:jgi/Psemu1/44297/gm1.44297_g
MMLSKRALKGTMPRVRSSSPSPRPRSQPRIRSPSPSPRPRSQPRVRSPSTSSSYPPDRLDAHIAHAVTAYHRSTSWGDFIRTIRGRGDIHPDVATIPHPAGSLLDRFGTDGTPPPCPGHLGIHLGLQLPSNGVLTNPPTRALTSCARSMPA